MRKGIDLGGWPHLVLDGSSPCCISPRKLIDECMHFHELIHWIDYSKPSESWLHLHIGGIDGRPSNTIKVDRACERCIIFQSASFTTSTITMRIFSHFFLWKWIKILRSRQKSVWSRRVMGNLLCLSLSSPCGTIVSAGSFLYLGISKEWFWRCSPPCTDPTLHKL